MKVSKRHRENVKKVDSGKIYELDEALALLKEFASAKFDETVELAVKVAVDTRKSDQIVRGTISLPKGTGQAVRVAVFAEGPQAEAATAAGADVVGGEELAKRVQDGWMEFDVAIAVPALMKVVGRLGRVLGPRGLMPSPKSGTVTDDVAAAVQEFKAGKIEFRCDPAGNIQVPVGKKSFSVDDLRENILAFLERVQQSRPGTVKGRFVESVVVACSMSPGVPLNLS